MSSAVTAPMRAAGWNVRFTIGAHEAPNEFAGVHQDPRAPQITFLDVCAELALCFEFPVDQNGDEISENAWTNIAFALTDSPDSDEVGDNTTVDYPSFVSRDSLAALVPGLSSPNMRDRRTVTYHIVRHKTCNLPAGLLKDHLRAKCANPLSEPSRFRHPSYLPYNKAPSDSRLNVMPLRRRLNARSQSPPKRSRSGSTSPSKPDDAADDEYNNMLAPASLDIDMDAAKRKVNEFRMACISQANCCAVSGDGEPWNPIQPIGPGVQACHIVPQQHYPFYPMPETDDAAQDSARRHCQAWHYTWSPDNGILLMKHLHDLFDARLFSIHPKTLRIRVFVPYQALARYHGRKAKVAQSVDQLAWRDDTASRTSTSGTSLVHTSGGSTPMSGRTTLPMTPTGNTPMAQNTLSTGDPSKRPRPTDDDCDDCDDKLIRKRQRRQDEHGLDSYITPYNSGAFLGNVNRELLNFRMTQ
ncbi:uncharacterized protein LMH87_007716 [Akanthomyces muscarius]|uniref:HNH nuclease domain-containing protein n=1 Tax=Akanthomyces muscarius TaxID=2231603 RepID=A0A9W8QM73_AKAMU|nr:uncharacterized protein LMH87_007716 [Akanthomyces muscarius]KAJ4161692.1 hypothetical protein LMH87_007716 [Akanthomyces muscarius]